MVTKIQSSGATVLFFGGYYAEAGLLLKQLKGAGWKGTMVAGDGVNDANFIKVAGDQVAEGTILTCPCAPATAAKGTFVDRLQGGVRTPTRAPTPTCRTTSRRSCSRASRLVRSSRADLNSFIDSYNGTGGATGVTYKFESNGELDPAQVDRLGVQGERGQGRPRHRDPQGLTGSVRSRHGTPGVCGREPSSRPHRLAATVGAPT